MTAITRKRNVPGYVDELGRFRPIRSASYIGSKSAPRKAKAADRKKYSRAKAGDLGKAKQERALEAPWDREYRLEQEAKQREQREQDRITRELEREIYGETSGRTSRGKGQTLAQFVRSEGGIRRTFRHGGQKARGKRSSWDSGEIDRLSRKQSGSSGLTTSDPRRGKTMDGMFQAAREAGFDVTDIDDLMSRVEAEVSTGKKTYSTHGSMTYNPKTKNPNVAETILQQLGGNKFAAMTGAKTFANTGNGLRFRLPANFASGGINLVTITLNGRDLYDVEFGKLRGAKYSVVRIDKNVYADMLRDLFTQRTGLDVSLGTMKNPRAKKNPARYVVKLIEPSGRMFVQMQSWAASAKAAKAEVLAAAKRQAALMPRMRGGKVPAGLTAEVMKANPDLLSMFANAAVGIASTLQINEMVKSRKRKAAPKKRGTTTAKAKKRTNPAHRAAALQKPARSKGVSRTRTKINASQPNLFRKQPKGELYVLTIGSGDDLISVYLHDGDKDGFSKRFKTMAGAKSYATRNKVKLVENPKQNGIIKRAWARSRAASEYRRELRLEAAAARARSRRQKAESKAKANPARGSANYKQAFGLTASQIRKAHDISLAFWNSISQAARNELGREAMAAKANPRLTAAEIKVINAIGPSRIGQPFAANASEATREKLITSLRKKGLLTASGSLTSDGYAMANTLKKKNPARRSASGKNAVARSAKANPERCLRCRKMTAEGIIDINAGFCNRCDAVKRIDLQEFKQLVGDRMETTARSAYYEFAKAHPKTFRVTQTAVQKARKVPKATIVRKWLAKAPARRNPKSTARRRTFEMFQGRRVTTARPMVVSNHAPANLDALGDLVELKIAGGPTLKFNGKGTKLCAANGKLWIAGKRFAKANPSAPANEINPIGEIDHVVYGTRKPHHGDHDYTHYIHKLGEESGRRPILCVDRDGYPVIRGGNYKIEARGIVD